MRNEAWHAAYERWQADCLSEWNERFNDQRTMYVAPGDDYDPGLLVEFAEDGDAYPHGAGGTGHVRQAVTPWAKSEHFME